MAKLGKKIKRFIGGLGGAMAFFGIVSSVLYFLKMNLEILVWIDSWGAGVGWGIRAGLVVFGILLLYTFRKSLVN